ncbi:MAG: hypothetical protein GX650_07550 [Clostridiales bacterium]|nr:hypothetical protein [Clostridiales bacterium]
MSKKKSLTILVIVLVVIAVAVGIYFATQKKAEKKALILGTGGTGGTYYALGGDIASLWMKKLNVDVTPTPRQPPRPIF